METLGSRVQFNAAPQLSDRGELPFTRRLCTPRASAGMVAVPPQASLPQGVRLRPGSPSDAAFLRSAVLRERLNPLGLHPERFTVAERQRPDGGAEIVGFGQIKPVSGGAALELSSLVVEEGERGRGLGATLVRNLVERAGGTPLFLMTIQQQAALYKRCGFEEVPASGLLQVPPFMVAEALAGVVVAWLVTRQRLVLMRLAAGSGQGVAAGLSEQQQAAGSGLPER